MLKRTWEDIKQSGLPGAPILSQRNDLWRRLGHEPVRILHRFAHRLAITQVHDRRPFKEVMSVVWHGERN